MARTSKTPMFDKLKAGATLTEAEMKQLYEEKLPNGVKLGDATREDLLLAKAHAAGKASYFERHALFYEAPAARRESDKAVRTEPDKADNQEQWWQYEIVELRRNIMLSQYATATANSERAARRRCHKDWPADEYRLHLIGHGPARDADSE